MKYVRLLKDTPNATAGTVFVRSFGSNCYRTYLDDSNVEFDKWTVADTLGEWFEEVEQIFVRPHNKEALAAVDAAAEEGDTILDPIEVTVDCEPEKDQPDPQDAFMRLMFPGLFN